MEIIICITVPLALYIIQDKLKESKTLRACLCGGEGPQVDEVTCLGGVTRLSI